MHVYGKGSGPTLVYVFQTDSPLPVIIMLTTGVKCTVVICECSPSLRFSGSQLAHCGTESSGWNSGYLFNYITTEHVLWFITWRTSKNEARSLMLEWWTGPESSWRLMLEAKHYSIWHICTMLLPLADGLPGTFHHHMKILWEDGIHVTDCCNTFWQRGPIGCLGDIAIYNLVTFLWVSALVSKGSLFFFSPCSTTVPLISCFCWRDHLNAILKPSAATPIHACWM